MAGEDVNPRIARLQARLNQLQRQANLRSEMRKGFEAAMREVLDGGAFNPSTNKKRFERFATLTIRYLQDAVAQVERDELPDTEHFMLSMSLRVQDLFKELGRMAAFKQTG